MHLYETHLPVANTRASAAFYVEMLGMTFAYRDPSRDIAFLWIEENRRSMLGLWGPGTEYGTALHKSHLAISVTLPELVTAGKKLNDSGIRTFNFAREETTEPSVIGWMPSAQLYFEDPDGHLLEFISLLDDQPEPHFIGSFSEWKKRASLVANGKP
jgi:lactoylglutathione lyase